jgi:hypothetical protein
MPFYCWGLLKILFSRHCSPSVSGMFLVSCERSEVIHKADIHWIASPLRFSDDGFVQRRQFELKIDHSQMHSNVERNTRNRKNAYICRIIEPVRWL